MSKRPTKFLIDEETQKHIRNIAREVFQEMIKAYDVKNLMPTDEDMPPEPSTITGEGKGRKENRQYERITVTIDEKLADLFKQEMKARTLSAGKLMDVILWNRYSKPRLSYEKRAKSAERKIE